MKAHNSRCIAATILSLALLTPLLFFTSTAASANDQIIATCPDGFELTSEGATCSRTELIIPGASTCPDGSLGDPAVYCYTLEAPTDTGETRCERGVPSGNLCIVSEPQSGGPPGCAPRYVADASSGICSRTEAASQGPEGCPSGSIGEADDCHIFLAPRFANGTCSAGQVIGPDFPFCVIATAPTDANDECPDGYSLAEPDSFFGLDCHYDGTGAEPPCPEDNGEVLVICKKRVANSKGAYFCIDRTAMLNGKFCDFTAEPGLGECPGGADTCSEFVPYYCPTGSTVTGDLCNSLEGQVPVLNCESRIYDGDLCRVILETGPTCANPEAVLTGTACVITMAAAVTCRDLPVTINLVTDPTAVGTAGNDVILGTNGPDVIDGGDGDDMICARGGNDVITGGNGADDIVAGTGDDIVSGDLGVDRIWGNGGNDTLNGNGGSDVIYAGAGDDIVKAGSGSDWVFGGPGNDDMSGQGGQDRMWGHAGDDVIQGNWQSDRIYGGEGDDILRGARGKDEIYGGPGNDELYGGVNTDFLDGGEGIDLADGQAGKDNPLVTGESGCIAETTTSC